MVTFSLLFDQNFYIFYIDIIHQSIHPHKKYFKNDDCKAGKIVFINMDYRTEISNDTEASI